ncbi:MAG: hypothetical protein WDN48_06315 [Pseudolabrys sp.]
MAEASAAARKSAKSPSAKLCTSKGKVLHQILPFELFLRTIWPHDRAKNYCRVTGKSLRTAKYKLAGGVPDFEDAVAILRSEHGFDFLQHVMGEAKPKWWRGVIKARSLGDMRRQLSEQQRRIAQLELAID